MTFVTVFIELAISEQSIINKNRADKLAQKKVKAPGKEYNYFVFHDLKRKGVSDTAGNKLEAPGYYSLPQLKIYDLKSP